MGCSKSHAEACSTAWFAHMFWKGLFGQEPCAVQTSKTQEGGGWTRGKVVINETTDVHFRCLHRILLQ